MAKMFHDVAATPKNPRWDKFIKREHALYKRFDDPRTDFIRDYNRLLHCLAYSRLKHKTQVFFAPENDHVCTRIEHVNHVTSISNTIANRLGLNTDLTNAIAIGHDIGHPPFGHEGESILKEISKREINQRFWHEKNSLRFADYIETLPDEDNCHRNLTLTYAVRDGLICHCGEIDDKALVPRQRAINLNNINLPGKTRPYSWEACVVRISDKIAYLGRDIEDALRLGIISTSIFYRELCKAFPEFDRKKLVTGSKEINNTTLIHSFIVDLCKSSDPYQGIRFSEWYLGLIKGLRDVSNKLIYESPRLKYSKDRAKLIIASIFDVLMSIYDDNVINGRITKIDHYPLLKERFSSWLIKYADSNKEDKFKGKYKNEVVYDIRDVSQYKSAIIDFIAAMTDNFAIRVFGELTRFG